MDSPLSPITKLPEAKLCIKESTHNFNKDCHDPLLLYVTFYYHKEIYLFVNITLYTNLESLPSAPEHDLPIKSAKTSTQIPNSQLPKRSCLECK